MVKWCFSSLDSLDNLWCQVARFGSESSGSQKVLKGLDDGFNALLGQLIFESMTYNESSHPVAGVEAVAATVWGGPLAPEEAGHTFRFVLLLTDGISADRPERFQQVVTDYTFNLAVVHILTAASRARMTPIEQA